jgi:hypothetical protein
VPAPVAAPPVAATAPVWPPPAAAPAALVIAAPAPAAAVATPAGVHRCWGDPGRLSGSGSGHRYWCGSDPCRGSSRHEQRCDVLESDSRHGGLLRLAAPALAYRITPTSVRPDLNRVQPVSGPARRMKVRVAPGITPVYNGVPYCGGQVVELPMPAAISGRRRWPAVTSPA